MAKSDASPGIALLALAGLAAVIVIAPIWGGLVFASLWNWFAPPFTAIHLSLPEAIGMACLISHLKGYKYPSDDEDDDRAARIVFGLLAPGILLLTGYIAHLYLRGAA